MPTADYPSQTASWAVPSASTRYTPARELVHIIYKDNHRIQFLHHNSTRCFSCDNHKHQLKVFIYVFHNLFSSTCDRARSFRGRSAMAARRVVTTAASPTLQTGVRIPSTSLSLRMLLLITTVVTTGRRRVFKVITFKFAPIHPRWNNGLPGGAIRSYTTATFLCFFI